MPSYDPNDINAVVSRMEQRQITNSDKLDRTLSVLERHDTRLTALEKSHWRQVGILSACSAGITVAVSFIVKLWTPK